MARSLFELVRGRRALKDAWLVIQRNGRTSKSPETRDEIAKFGEDADLNIERIQKLLRKRQFVFKPAKGVRGKKPGKTDFRPIVIAPVESRIVQRAVHDVLMTDPGVEALVRSQTSFGGVKSKEGDDYSAVPAAVKAVLEAIGSGCSFVKRTDISKFFTRIPKSEVRKLLESVVAEQEMLELFDAAIALELSNMQRLRDDAKKFPIEDIGVAQGNSLSSMMGNILLRDFDLEMNALPNIRCIRYIDDFIILGPNRHATVKAFERAKMILSKWQMTLADDKTEEATVRESFEFLGIEFCNGLIRPAKRKRCEHLESIREILQGAKAALFGYKAERKIEKKVALLKSLSKVSDTMHSWGTHYWFCNDSNCLAQLDKEIALLVDEYLGVFRAVIRELGPEVTWDLLGIESLQKPKLKRDSFTWAWPAPAPPHRPKLAPRIPLEGDLSRPPLREPPALGPQ